MADKKSSDAAAKAAMAAAAAAGQYDPSTLLCKYQRIICLYSTRKILEKYLLSVNCK